MKKYLYTILISGILLSGLSLMPSNAYAECQAIYGGGQTCPPSYSFSVQKFVQTPGKGSNADYVNNLSINDPKYSPTQTVSFKITVQNTGSQTIPTITVTDKFPQFINFVSGSGSFDSNSKVLTYTIGNLAAGQTSTQIVTGKIAEANLMPSDQGVVCLINQATGTDSSGVTNTSSSQFCIQKSVLGTTEPQVFAAPKIVKTPATGTEMLPLMALIPGGLAGFILRKKSIKK